MYRGALIVLLGASSYGMLSTIVKLAYRDGYSVYDVINAQYFFGWCMLLFMTIVFKSKKISLKSGALLMFAGTTASLTGFFYGIALETLSASLSVILLFQFTWIGIVIDAVRKKRVPTRELGVSLLFLFVGTFLSSGLIWDELSDVHLKGVLFGILAAITFALFIQVNGSVASNEPPLLRSLWMMTGSTFILWLLFTPSFLYNGSLQSGLWKYGFILGVLGIILPSICFAIGVPIVGHGISTILGAAELPIAVIASMLILHETITWMQWLGILLILIGMAMPQLLQLKKVKEKINISSGSKY